MEELTTRVINLQSFLMIMTKKEKLDKFNIWLNVGAGKKYKDTFLELDHNIKQFGTNALFDFSNVLAYVPLARNNLEAPDSDTDVEIDDLLPENYKDRLQSEKEEPLKTYDQLFKKYPSMRTYFEENIDKLEIIHKAYREYGYSVRFLSNALLKPLQLKRSDSAITKKRVEVPNQQEPASVTSLKRAKTQRGTFLTASLLSLESPQPISTEPTLKRTHSTFGTRK